MSFLIRHSSQIISRNFVNLSKIASRCSSFRSSETFKGYNAHPQVQIVRNPIEWKYVENVLPPLTVPVPNPKLENHSLWKPACVQPGAYQYMIHRNKNHMLPIYMKKTFRGLRRITLVRRIDGDIWQLEKELKAYIEKSIDKEIVTRVNELAGQIYFRGDFVEILHKYLFKKGF